MITYQLKFPIPSFEAKTNEATFTMPGGNGGSQTGIEGVSEVRFGVYPNPAADWTRVYVDGQGTVEVYSLTGAKMVSMPVNEEAEINVSDWARGMYIVRFTSLAGKTAATRLMH